MDEKNAENDNEQEEEDRQAAWMFLGRTPNLREHNGFDWLCNIFRLRILFYRSNCDVFKCLLYFINSSNILTSFNWFNFILRDILRVYICWWFSLN